MVLKDQQKTVLQQGSLWLPVLIQMGLIFYYSAQPAGSPALERFPAPAGIGHLVGYAILGFLLYRAFNGGVAGWSREAAGYALLVGVIYAVSDEVHQVFVPGREASFFDVVIDTVGLLAALLVVWVLNRNKTI